MRSNDHDLSLVIMGTLTLWVSCLTVGVVGLVWPHQPPTPRREQAPVQAVMLNATLEAQEPEPEVPQGNSAAALAPSPQAPPPLSATEPPPPAPPMVAVAEASPAISFSAPTKDLAVIVAPPAAAAPVVAAPPTPKAQPASVQRLTYGRGEGAQPAPAYPRECIVAQQQGTVLVRFDVDEHGRVTSSEVVRPCPFPLLNQAAVRAVRESWRFKTGPLRTYEVAIQFQLK